MSQIDQLVEASGANLSAREDFTKLKDSIHVSAKNPVDAAIQIKRALREKGFSYRAGAFKLQDVLANKGGNCLGLPMLVGCILDENGFSPSYRLVIRPKDVVDDLERRFHSNVLDETSYERPELTGAVDDPLYRFVPLEHLAIDVDGKGFVLETTSDEDRLVVDAEGVIPVTFDGALSQVYKDRALEALSEDRHDESLDFIRRGLSLWKGNRQLYCALASLAGETFDDDSYNEALSVLSNGQGNDSLWNLNRYYATQDSAFLDGALERYPAFAEAIAARAREMTEQDPREARFLFSVASQLYANSQNLDSGSFYVANLEELRNLFGSNEVLRRLVACKEEKFGDFDYHLAMYNLTGDESHLFEAEEAAVSPRQRLYLGETTRDTPYFNPEDMGELEMEFSDSRVYEATKKDLKTGKTT
tara:strand:- start:457 stop:1710 length:1254 start_codon:yes stop_codon:yes gene_type:complete